MAFYETVFIARQDLSAAQVEALATNLTDILKKGEGDVTKTEFCGLRSLAYSINKNRKGHYVLFNIEAPSAAVQEMERQMRINEDILRFLTIKVEELDPEPSALMQSKQHREKKYESFEDRDPYRPYESKTESEGEDE